MVNCYCSIKLIITHSDTVLLIELRKLFFMSYPIFIVGVGRSGTSLLHALLSTSDDLTTLQETGFIRRYGFGVDLERLKEDKKFHRNEDIYNRHSMSHNLGEFYSSLVAEGKRVLDKDPSLIHFIPRVRRQLSTSKFIHIYRNPVSVVESKKKANWSSGKPFWQYALVHAIQTRAAALERGEEHFFEISYERLIDNTTYTINDIGEWLQVGFCLRDIKDHTEKSKVRVFDDEKSWKQNVLSKVGNKTLVHAKTLSSGEQYILHRIMEANGISDYSQLRCRLPVAQRGFCELYSFSIRIIAGLYIQVRRFLDTK